MQEDSQEEQGEVSHSNEQGEGSQEQGDSVQGQGEGGQGPQRDIQEPQDGSLENRRRNNNLFKIQMKPRKIDLYNKPGKNFTFLDTFFINMFICNKRKRNFVQKVNRVISLKLSVENILGFFTDFELLKRKIFTNEEYVEFNELEYLTLEEQMKDLEI